MATLSAGPAGGWLTVGDDEQEPAEALLAGGAWGFLAVADGVVDNRVFAIGMGTAEQIQPAALDALTLDEWRWNADEMNRIAETAAAAGLRCAYHNHAMEFVAYDGTVAFDELLKRTDASLVDIELDCAWVAGGGENPADYLKKIAERTTLLHIKDVIDADAEKIETTAVGSGVIDWRAVFEAVDPAQLAHYFVEQEHFRSTPLEAIRRSFDYLTSPEMAAVGGARG